MFKKYLNLGYIYHRIVSSVNLSFPHLGTKDGPFYILNDRPWFFILAFTGMTSTTDNRDNSQKPLFVVVYCLMPTSAKHKIIAVVGPTSSGKSDIAVLIAKKINGEIISADSRQVYKGMNIGTGKITKKEMCGVPHHLLDMASPKDVFTVSDYKKLAEKAIGEIARKGKIPILCGGTGLYIRAVIDDLNIPDVPPNNKLRRELYRKDADELFVILKKLDPRRAKGIDAKNPARLVRAIEIATAIGRVPEYKINSSKFDVLEIGLILEKEILRERIKTRLLKRIKAGMVSEIKKLHENGVSWKRLNDFGLEYRYVSKYLKRLKHSPKANVRPIARGDLGKLTKSEMIEKLNSEIIKYSKRQMTWFKADKRIKWFNSLKDTKKIIEEVQKFVK